MLRGGNSSSPTADCGLWLPQTVQLQLPRATPGTVPSCATGSHQHGVCTAARGAGTPPQQPGVPAGCCCWWRFWLLRLSCPSVPSNARTPPRAGSAAWPPPPHRIPGGCPTPNVGTAQQRGRDPTGRCRGHPPHTPMGELSRAVPPAPPHPIRSGDRHRAPTSHLSFNPSQGPLLPPPPRVPAWDAAHGPGVPVQPPHSLPAPRCAPGRADPERGLGPGSPQHCGAGSC